MMPQLSREAFAHSYFAGSQIAEYRIEGERVYWGGGFDYILPCSCGEPECEGWAMITPSCKGWHEFQNGRMSYNDACALDLEAIRQMKEEG